MFGFRKRKAEVISHWYSIIDGFQTSTQDFYDSVERELEARKVPGLDKSRIEFAEGGILSDKRLYLRMIRERLVFDVCAAPFGTAFFFSCRFAEIPAKVNPLVILLLPILALLYWKFMIDSTRSYIEGTFWAVFFALFVLWVCRNAVTMGWSDLDSVLMRIPLIGPLYERYLRAETYYRQDTRLMYLDVVNRVVKGKVEEVAGAQGQKRVRFNVHNPQLEELYKRKVVEPGVEEPEP